MMKIVPNLITCLNVICGSVAILLVMYGRIEVAALFILLGMVFDFFDGLAARLLHVQSEMGKELDSLADMVSFGVAPAMLAHALIKQAFGVEGDLCGLTGWQYFCIGIPLIIPAFSAWRLAKFNLDTRQSYSFIGMPTPANALFWVSLVLTASVAPAFYARIWEYPWLLATLAVVLSVLLLAELPMFSFKFKNFSWKENSVRYIFLAIVVLMVAIGGLKMISFIIPLYVLLSLVSGRGKFN